MSIKAYSQKNQYAFALLICSNMSNVLKGRVTYKSKPWYSLVYMYFYMVIWWCCNAQSASSPVWRCWREEEHYVVHKPHPPPVWFWSFEKRGCCHCSEIEPSHRGKKKEYIVVGPCVCALRSSLCYLHLFFFHSEHSELCVLKKQEKAIYAAKLRAIYVYLGRGWLLSRRPLFSHCLILACPYDLWTEKSAFRCG